jgi:sialic acid synthase SpsE
LSLLIAEISNHHNGSVAKACELIHKAKECGADIVKGQAFRSKDMLKYGSMNEGFYTNAEMNYKDYVTLIEYGKKIGIDVFFTVVSPCFSALYSKQKYQKIHAQSFKKKPVSSISNNSNIIISTRSYKKGMTRLYRCKWMYATDYMKPICIQTFNDFFDLCNWEINFGISHHGHVDDLIKFVGKNRGLPIIEKHFFLGDNIYDSDGNIYRDCVHSANPREFKELARIYKRKPLV